MTLRPENGQSASVEVVIPGQEKAGAQEIRAKRKGPAFKGPCMRILAVASIGSSGRSLDIGQGKKLEIFLFSGPAWSTTEPKSGHSGQRGRRRALDRPVVPGWLEIEDPCHQDVRVYGLGTAQQVAGQHV